MDDDDQEFVRHLFAVLSARAEQVHDLAVAGQAGSLSVKEQGDLASRLEVAVADVTDLARALAVLMSANGSESSATDRPKTSPRDQTPDWAIDFDLERLSNSEVDDLLP